MDIIFQLTRMAVQIIIVRIYIYIYIFIHLAVCLTTGPKPLPKRALHIVRSRVFSFKWEYPLLSLRSSNSFRHLLLCLPVTSIPPCIFPSVTCYRRQFLRKMWPIQFAFRLRISCRIFLCSLTVYIHIYIFQWRNSPQCASASSLSKPHDHSQTHHTR
jgi:hypothetical protein